MAKSIDQSLQGFSVALENFLLYSDVITRAIPDIEQLLRTSIEDNFRFGGRFGNDNPWGGGNQHWPESDRAKSEGGKTLVDTAHLLNSIEIRIVYDGKNLIIYMSANPIYAAVHHFGGKAGRGGSVTLPARPFLVIQNEDLQGIVEMLAEAFLLE